MGNTVPGRYAGSGSFFYPVAVASHMATPTIFLSFALGNENDAIGRQAEESGLASKRSHPLCGQISPLDVARIPRWAFSRTLVVRHLPI